MKPMKKTNPKQFERLVELMKQNPAFARGCHRLGMSKTNVKQKWLEFGAELNALGPPMRPGHEWQRVWMDMKGKVKKILACARREQAGGETERVQSLTPLQREIDKLLLLSTHIKVEELSDEWGPANTITSPSLDLVLEGQSASSPACSRSDETTEPSRNPRTASKRKRRRPFEDERCAILKKQTKLLDQAVGEMAVIGANVAKLADVLAQQTLVLKQAVKLMEKKIVE